MKMVELKCKNCGSNLEVEEGVTKVTCKYCDTTFEIEDAYTEAYKQTKGTLKAQSEHQEEQMQKMKEMMKNSPAGKASIFVYIFAFGIFAFIISMMVIMPIVGVKEQNKWDIDIFNQNYENRAGEESGFLIKPLLDSTVTNNKKDSKHQIEVEYNEISSKEEKGIKEIRNSLDDHKKYDVSYDYDKKGYIIKMTIEDIK